MELLLAAVIGGIAFGLLLIYLIWRVVGSAVENLLDWLIHTFGNESAARRVEEKWANRH